MVRSVQIGQFYSRSESDRSGVDAGGSNADGNDQTDADTAGHDAAQDTGSDNHHAELVVDIMFTAQNILLWVEVTEYTFRPGHRFGNRSRGDN